MWNLLFPIVGKLLEQVLPDPKAAADAKLKMLELAQQGQLAQLDADVKAMVGQLEINKAEASSTNWFVAGARPFILWICGIAFLYASVLEPVARFVAQVVYNYTGAFPAIDTNMTMQVMLGMLGLGAMRTFEKVKNAEGNRS